MISNLILAALIGILNFTKETIITIFFWSFFKKNSWVVVGWLIINIFFKVKFVNEMEMEFKM